MSTLDFANKYQFGPLDIKNVRWGKMNDGYYDGCGLLSVQMTNADMNKIGSLLLHKGYYNGKAVVPEKWVAEILYPTTTKQTPKKKKKTTYALCFYHFNYNGTPI